MIPANPCADQLEVCCDQYFSVASCLVDAVADALDECTPGCTFERIVHMGRPQLGFERDAVICWYERSRVTLPQARGLPVQRTQFYVVRVVESGWPDTNPGLRASADVLSAATRFVLSHVERAESALHETIGANLAGTRCKTAYVGEFQMQQRSGGSVSWEQQVAVAGWS